MKSLPIEHKLASSGLQVCVLYQQASDVLKYISVIFVFWTKLGVLRNSDSSVSSIFNYRSDI